MRLSRSECLLCSSSASPIVLSGALLFTNAVEWVGHELGLGEGAVGSVLAAVGTAMPETLIAIVALLSVDEGSEDVAIGAIVGAPFLLATLAMGLVGLFAYLYRDTTRAGGASSTPHGPTLERDLLFFLVFFALAGLLAWGPPAPVRIAVGIGFLARLRLLRPPHPALRRRGAGGGDAEPADLRPPRRAPRRPGPRRSASCSSWSASGRWSAAPTSSSKSCSKIADSLGVEALVLALILAPLATELPEKVNSFFWVREGKDALALGNISGAMVFQSTIPVGIGLIFTDWDLSGNADPLDRPRPRRRHPRLREPPPGPPLQTPRRDRLVRLIRRLHHRGRCGCLSAALSGSHQLSHEKGNRQATLLPNPSLAMVVTSAHAAERPVCRLGD